MNVDATAPAFWKDSGEELFSFSGDKAPKPASGKLEATFSDQISKETREWLHACWTNPDRVKAGIASGVDIHTANTNGFTGLHMAAWKFRLDIAQLLVEAGHDVNVEDASGSTPLDKCYDHGDGKQAYYDMVEFLESKGGLRKHERVWLAAANQERYAPNAGA